MIIFCKKSTLFFIYLIYSFAIVYTAEQKKQYFMDSDEMRLSFMLNHEQFKDVQEYLIPKYVNLYKQFPERMLHYNYTHSQPKACTVTFLDSQYKTIQKFTISDFMFLFDYITVQHETNTKLYAK